MFLCDNGVSNKARFHNSEKHVSETVLDLLSADKIYVSGNSLAIISCLTKGWSPGKCATDLYRGVQEGECTQTKK